MSTAAIHVLVRSNLYQKQDCTLNVYISSSHTRPCTVKPVSKTRLYFKCICQQQLYTSLYSQTCIKNNNVLYMFMSASDIHVLVQSNLYQKQECTLNVYSLVFDTGLTVQGRVWLLLIYTFKVQSCFWYRFDRTRTCMAAVDIYI
jgi:hypothetical protein